MAEVRKQMYWQQLIGMHQRMPETIIVDGLKHILILLHNLADKVTIVVKHDGNDGNATHR